MMHKQLTLHCNDDTRDELFLSVRGREAYNNWPESDTQQDNFTACPFLMQVVTFTCTGLKESY